MSHPVDLPQLPISVIIPVYRGMEPLEKCLEALLLQTYPAHLVEIVVVDNGENPGIEKWSSRSTSLRIIRCDAAGSYHARNAGIAAATHEVLAFTDADCVPLPQWLAEGVRAYSQNLASGWLGGKIIQEFENAGNPTAGELIERHYFPLDQSLFLRTSGFVATANLFSTKSIFRKVGLFATTLKSSGDREWCQRAQKYGFQGGVCPKAIILHPYRSSLSSILLKARRLAGGRVDLLKSSPNWRTQALKLFLKELVPPARLFMRIIVAPEIRGWRLKLGFTSMFLAVKYTRCWEFFSLLLGKKSVRG